MYKHILLALYVIRQAMTAIRTFSTTRKKFASTYSSIFCLHSSDKKGHSFGWPFGETA